MSSDDSLALNLEHDMQPWDRAQWAKVFKDYKPSIREVSECLGLGLSSTSKNRGMPKFDKEIYRELSMEATRLSKELPKEQNTLRNFAADPRLLNQKLEELLARYGCVIWGRNADRSCLFTRDATKRTYNKELFYEKQEHKNIIKIHLHRWIIIKAFYNIRNLKLKRTSGKNEYDQLADIDGNGFSPHGTPQSLTPPDPETVASADLDVKPFSLKKRQSDARLNTSDDDDLEAPPPVKRPYSTLPVSRKGNPRKSLKSLYPAGPGSMEDVPPMPTHVPRSSPAPPTASDPARLQLSPSSNNDLNGVSRPPAITRNSASFAHRGFTAANNTPSASEPPREPIREPTRELSKEVHRPPAIGHWHSNTHTSPYEPSSHSWAVAQSATDIPRSAPPATSTPAPNQEFQLINTSSAADGTSAHMKKGSSAVQPAQQAHIAPQPQQQPSQARPQGSQQTRSKTLHLHQFSPHGQPIQPTHPQHTHHRSRPHNQAQQQPTHRPLDLAHSLNHPSSGFLAPCSRSRCSKSNSPAASNQPTMAPLKQVASAPAIQSAPAYDIRLVPIQDAPNAASSKQRVPSHAGQPAPWQHASPHEPVLKSQQQQPETAHAMQPPQNFPRCSVSTADFRFLQCEVTASLFTFFDTRSTMPSDEPALLVRMHTLWFHGEALFRAELPQHFDRVSKILTAWLHERQAIASLRHSMQANPGVSHVGLVDRLLAMNDLRAMRLKWKKMSSIDGLSPEDLLCMAFKVMTNTEGSEHLFKDGLARLELGVLEYLRSEDLKIVMQRRDTRGR